MAAFIAPIISIVGSIIDKVIPDKAAAERAKTEFFAQAQAHEFQLMLEQIKVNTAEAASTNWFVAGWRPFVGWTCGVALAYTYILLPFLQFFVFTFGGVTMVNKLSRLPALDLGQLLPILVGMLGLGVMRTFEKVKDVEARR